MSLSEIDFFKISGSSWWRHRLAVRGGEQRCVTTKEKVWKMEKMRLRLRLARRQQTPQTFWERGHIFPMHFSLTRIPFCHTKKSQFFFGKKSGLRQFFPCLEACFKDWSQAQAVFSSLLVCGDNSLTYIIFVIFSPHGTFLATIFLHTKSA